MNDRIVLTPQGEARHAFDAQHNVEPGRAIAERIGRRYGCGPTHSLVDAISSAIEDARELGKQRAAFEQNAGQSK